jgi:hypothetical protein
MRANWIPFVYSNLEVLRPAVLGERVLGHDMRERALRHRVLGQPMLVRGQRPHYVLGLLRELE